MQGMLGTVVSVKIADSGSLVFELLQGINRADK